MGVKTQTPKVHTEPTQGAPCPKPKHAQNAAGWVSSRRRGRFPTGSQGSGAWRPPWTRELPAGQKRCL